MSRRKCYRDRQKAGSSRLVPYVPGEPAGVRHARRLIANTDNRDALRCWCEKHQIEFTITNMGEHWKFVCPNGRTVQWWPSTAKMVIDEKWRKGIHVHDWEQARLQIAKVAGIRMERK